METFRFITAGTRPRPSRMRRNPPPRSWAQRYASLRAERTARSDEAECRTPKCHRHQRAAARQGGTPPNGGLRIGALVRNSDLAHDPTVMQNYAVLSQALLSGASPQLRNMATTGGNLLQRTRCVYFRDTAHACNKREPGSGCSAMDGENRTLAILGTSEDCIASNPSDMNVALAALEATIHVRGTKESAHPDPGFLSFSGKTPNRETVLEPGDLITYVTLPARRRTQSLYLKLRDRAAYGLPWHQRRL